MVTRAKKRAGPPSVASGATDRGTRVYEQLRELIVWGRIAPGTRIIEAEVATRLGVSRTPVRAALQRLQQEGYVVAAGKSQQSRLSVAPLTQDDARELFEVVAEVEGLAARRAAEQPDDVRRDLVARLDEINFHLERAANASDPDGRAIFDLDQSFHRTYVEVGGGPRILALHDAVKPQSERYIRLYVSALVDEIGTSVREHDVIIRAIEAGEPEFTQTAVRRNWRNAADRMGKVIEHLGERGAW
ncbi:MAG: GntR family transcriptional regulator [Gemmatimonadota bacterium]|jgi:DNA-binding GntR family transcriptional regulator